jgi:flagellin
MPVTTSNHHHNSKEGVLMIINTNIGSNTAARILANSTSALQKSLQRLSTGSKIASISDDAAGMAVANKLGAQITRSNAVRDNLSNAISFSQTQEGYLSQVSSALERMSELATLSTDATKTLSDRELYQKEFSELNTFISAVKGKKFNDLALFSSSAFDITTNLNDATGAAMTFALTGANFGTLASTLGITTAALANTALDTIQAAITGLAANAAQVGANLSRLESERASISVLRDNLSAARSRIVDVDVAEESANFAKQQILVQSGTAMLAQANILPQSALRLIS